MSPLNEFAGDARRELRPWGVFQSHLGFGGTKDLVNEVSCHSGLWDDNHRHFGEHDYAVAAWNLILKKLHEKRRKYLDYAVKSWQNIRRIYFEKLNEFKNDGDCSFVVNYDQELFESLGFLQYEAGWPPAVITRDDVDQLFIIRKYYTRATSDRVREPEKSPSSELGGQQKWKHGRYIYPDFHNEQHHSKIDEPKEIGDLRELPALVSELRELVTELKKQSKPKELIMEALKEFEEQNKIKEEEEKNNDAAKETKILEETETEKVQEETLKSEKVEQSITEEEGLKSNKVRWSVTVENATLVVRRSREEDVPREIDESTKEEIGGQHETASADVLPVSKSFIERRCDICTKVFSSESVLRDHKKYMHAQENKVQEDRESPKYETYEHSYVNLENGNAAKDVPGFISSIEQESNNISETIPKFETANQLAEIDAATLPKISKASSDPQKIDVLSKMDPQSQQLVSQKLTLTLRKFKDEHQKLKRMLAMARRNKPTTTRIEETGQETLAASEETAETKADAPLAPELTVNSKTATKLATTNIIDEVDTSTLTNKKQLTMEYLKRKRTEMHQRKEKEIANKNKELIKTASAFPEPEKVQNEAVTDPEEMKTESVEETQNSITKVTVPVLISQNADSPKSTVISTCEHIILHILAALITFSVYHIIMN